MTAKIVRFSDYEAAYKPRLPSEESALVIILPVIRIERYDDAIASVMGRPMRAGQRQRLARHMKDIEDV